MTRWNICFADREYACYLGDPDLGQMEADTQEEALEKAWADREISRRRFGHTCGLWACRAKDDEQERS
jgi:hypothetical protein